MTDFDQLVNDPALHKAIRRKGQKVVAARLACPPTYLCDWLAGRKLPSLEFRLRAAEAVGFVVLVRAVPKRRNKTARPNPFLCPPLRA